MTTLGANIDELEQLAKEMGDSARLLRVANSELRAALGKTHWQGRDADSFRRTYRNTHSKNLDRLSSRLQEHQRHLKAQAKDQREASDATGAGPGGGGGGGGWGKDDGYAKFLKGLEKLLEQLGLAHDQVETIKEIIDDLIKKGVLDPKDLGRLGELLNNKAFLKSLKVLGKAVDVGDVLIAFFSDYGDQKHLPTDERIVHALTEAAIKVGISAGVDAGITFALGALGSVVPVLGTAVGAAIGKAIGFVVGEAIEWAISKADEHFEVSEWAADRAVEDYRRKKDVAGQVWNGAQNFYEDHKAAFNDPGKWLMSSL